MHLLTLYTLPLSDNELKVLRRVVEVAKGENQFVLWNTTTGPGFTEDGPGIHDLFEDTAFNRQAGGIINTLSLRGLIALSYRSKDSQQFDITEAARVRLAFEKLSPRQQELKMRGLQRKSSREQRQGTIAFYLALVLAVLQILEMLGINIRLLGN